MKAWTARKSSIVDRAKRSPAWAVLAAVALSLTATAALADCTADVNGIMKRRMGAVALINASAKKNGGKLDPIAACPQLRSLASVEAEASAYFTKNGEWCNLPPEFAQKMAEAHAKSVTFATKACAVAVKMKQMKQQQVQQAVEAAPKLPEGPL